MFATETTSFLNNLGDFSLDMKVSLWTVLSVILMAGGGIYFVKKLWASTGGVLFTFIGHCFKGIVSVIPTEKLGLVASYLVAAVLCVCGLGTTGYGVSTMTPSQPKNMREAALVKALEIKEDGKEGKMEMVKYVVEKADESRYQTDMESYSTTVAASKPFLPSGATISGGIALALLGIGLIIRTVQSDPCGRRTT